MEDVKLLIKIIIAGFKASRYKIKQVSMFDFVATRGCDEIRFTSLTSDKKSVMKCFIAHLLKREGVDIPSVTLFL